MSDKITKYAERGMIALTVALIGIGSYQQTGFGKRGDIVEDLFTISGQEYILVREDIRLARDRFYAEPAESSSVFAKGMTLNPYRDSSRQLTGDITTDSGDEIKLNGRSYSVNGREVR